ncbi:MAG: 50S ribosomal protein L4 [Candidatus Saccharimonadales bacterium]
MAIATYTKTGTKATVAAKLDKAVFGVEVKNHELLKQAYVGYLANRRSAHAKTKTRGEVIGSNIKPWKQKGTGRARFGSKYNPIWRGGGIVFGPTGYENYTKKLTTSAKRLATRQALSLAAEANKVSVIEDFIVKDAKTATTVTLLAKLDAAKNVLVIVANKTDELIRATRNIQSIKLVSATYINVYDVLNADTIIVTTASLEIISQWLTTPATSKEVTS